MLFILCFGSSSLEKTINAVKLGVQSEFVAQLAYLDGLTRIGNRTSFEEHLVDLEKIKAAGHPATIMVAVTNSDDLASVEAVASGQLNPGDQLMCLKA